jgi:hypothetical protein
MADGPFITWPTLTRRSVLAASMAAAAAVAARGLNCAAATRSGERAAVAAESETSILIGASRLCVESVMDTLLPDDEAPGVIAVGGLTFVEVILRDARTMSQRQTFLDGVEALRDVLRGASGAEFPSVPLAHRSAVLEKYDASAFAHAAAGLATLTLAEQSYLQIKELAVISFFTSERVGKTLLDYSPVPGLYAADIPLTPQMRTYHEDRYVGGWHHVLGKLP